MHGMIPIQVNINSEPGFQVLPSTVSYLMLTVNLCGKYSYDHLTEKETEVRSIKSTFLRTTEHSGRQIGPKNMKMMGTLCSSL